MLKMISIFNDGENYLKCLVTGKRNFTLHRYYLLTESPSQQVTYVTLKLSFKVDQVSMKTVEVRPRKVEVNAPATAVSPT